MIDQQTVPDLIGATVKDADGSRIGKIAQVYLDDDGGQPEWATVNTGLFGTKESFVPLREASIRDGDVVVPVSKAQVKDAPQIDEDGHLSPEQEDELYRHYRLDSSAGTGVQAGTLTDTTAGTEQRAAGYETDGRGTAATGRDTAGRDTSGPTTDDAMTRSEERLNVGTERVETGRARLRKYVTTRDESVQVPVSHEEVRVEREPITDASRDEAMSGPGISEEEHEVTLHEERPVVNKETVPVERVRMGTETVTGSEQVGGEVRSEQVEVEGDGREAGVGREAAGRNVGTGRDADRDGNPS